MTVKGGSRPACAACRFQRRRCASDCPLAPYFPADQPKIFQTVHRLYGVGNIMKILSQLKNDEQKDEAMKSIKYESNIRQIYRVHGCYGLLAQLQEKIAESMKELQYIRRLIDARKKNIELKESDPDEINDHVVGGSGDWATEMINGGNDLGFYHVNGFGDHFVSYDWDNEHTKPSIDLIRNSSRLDEIQELCSVEQKEESVDYTETTSGSFVDDFNLKSSIKDTIHFAELGESKPNAKLFHVQEGVHRLTTGS